MAPTTAAATPTTGPTRRSLPVPIPSLSRNTQADEQQEEEEEDTNSSTCSSDQEDVAGSPPLVDKNDDSILFGALYPHYQLSSSYSSASYSEPSLPTSPDRSTNTGSSSTTATTTSGGSSSSTRQDDSTSAHLNERTRYKRAFQLFQEAQSSQTRTIINLNPSASNDSKNEAKSTRRRQKRSRTMASSSSAKLCRLLWNRKWDAVLDRLHQPNRCDAKRASKLPCFSNGGKGLPLHLACAMRPLPPYSIVESLVKQYPQATREKASMWGLLPLHLAVDLRPGRGVSSLSSSQHEPSCLGLLMSSTSNKQQQQQQQQQHVLCATDSDSIPAASSTSIASSTSSASVSNTAHNDDANYLSSLGSFSPLSNYRTDDDQNKEMVMLLDNNDHCKIVQLLLETYPQALYTREEFHGMMPIHIAASSALTVDGKVPPSSAFILRRLLQEAGETLAETDHAGDTPLILARRRAATTRSNTNSTTIAAKTTSQIVSPLPDWKWNPILYPASVPSNPNMMNKSHPRKERNFIASLLVGSMEELMNMSSTSASSSSAEESESCTDGSSYYSSDRYDDDNSADSSSSGRRSRSTRTSSLERFDNHQNDENDDDDDDDDMDHEWGELAMHESALRKELEESIRLHCCFQEELEDTLISIGQDDAIVADDYQQNAEGSKVASKLVATDDSASEMNLSIGTLDFVTGTDNEHETDVALPQHASNQAIPLDKSIHHVETLEEVVHTTERLLEDTARENYSSINCASRADDDGSLCDDDLSHELEQLSAFEESLRNDLESAESYVSFLQNSRHPSKEEVVDSDPVSPTEVHFESSEEKSSCEIGISSLVQGEILEGDCSGIVQEQESISQTNRKNDADTRNDEAHRSLPKDKLSSPVEHVWPALVGELSSNVRSTSQVELDRAKHTMPCAFVDPSNKTSSVDNWDEIPLSPVAGEDSGDDDDDAVDAAVKVSTNADNGPDVCDAPRHISRGSPSRRARTKIEIARSSFPSVLWGLPSIKESSTLDTNPETDAVVEESERTAHDHSEANDGASTVDQQICVEVFFWERINAVKTPDVIPGSQSNIDEKGWSAALTGNSKDISTIIFWERASAKTPERIDHCPPDAGAYTKDEPAGIDRTKASIVTWARVPTSLTTREGYQAKQCVGPLPKDTIGKTARQDIQNEEGERTIGGSPPTDQRESVEGIATSGALTSVREEAKKIIGSPSQPDEPNKFSLAATDAIGRTEARDSRDNALNTENIDDSKCSKRIFWKFDGSNLVADFFDQTGDLASLFQAKRDVDDSSQSSSEKYLNPIQENTVETYDFNNSECLESGEEEDTRCTGPEELSCKSHQSEDAQNDPHIDANIDGTLPVNGEGGAQPKTNNSFNPKPRQGPITELQEQLHLLKKENDFHSKEVERLKQRVSIMTEIKGVSLDDLRKALQDVCACSGVKLNLDEEEIEDSRMVSAPVDSQEQEETVPVTEVLHDWYEELKDKTLLKEEKEEAPPGDQTYCSTPSLSPPRIIKTNDGIANWSIKENSEAALNIHDSPSAVTEHISADVAQDLLGVVDLNQSFNTWFKELLEEDIACKERRQTLSSTFYHAASKSISANCKPSNSLQQPCDDDEDDDDKEDDDGDDDGSKDSIIGLEIRTDCIDTSDHTRKCMEKQESIQVKANRRQRLRQIVEKRMRARRFLNADELVENLLNSRRPPSRHQERPNCLDQAFDDVWERASSSSKGSAPSSPIITSAPFTRGHMSYCSPKDSNHRRGSPAMYSSQSPTIGYHSRGMQSAMNDNGQKVQSFETVKINSTPELFGWHPFDHAPTKMPEAFEAQSLDSPIRRARKSSYDFQVQISKTTTRPATIEEAEAANKRYILSSAMEDIVNDLLEEESKSSFSLRYAQCEEESTKRYQKKRRVKISVLDRQDVMESCQSNCEAPSPSGCCGERFGDMLFGENLKDMLSSIEITDAALASVEKMTIKLKSTTDAVPCVSPDIVEETKKERNNLADCTDRVKKERHLLDQKKYVSSGFIAYIDELISDLEKTISSLSSQVQSLSSTSRQASSSSEGKDLDDDGVEVTLGGVVEDQDASNLSACKIASGQGTFTRVRRR